MRLIRWPVVVACAVVLSLAGAAATRAYARGGGGGGGGGGGQRGKKKGGMSSPQGRGDYMAELQREESEGELAGFLDDATREPLRALRTADRLNSGP